MTRTNRWIIVGGGASGLAAAFFLKKLGIDSLIVERDATIGGRMGTIRLGSRALDCGGKNIGRRYQLFREFAASLGTHPFEYFGLNSSQVQNGVIRTFDANRRWSSLLDLARGLSALDAVRFGGLLLRVKANEANGYIGSDLSRSLAFKYDAAPASDYFSTEFCNRILRPMTVRMNGAEPDEVFMGNLGSNVRMVLDTYEQFKHGLAPLLQSFQFQYKVELNATTQSLIVQDGRVCGVQVRHANGETAPLLGDGVILATPAPVSAALAESTAPQLAVHLRSVAYHPVTLILAEYDRAIFSPAVRALVFDKAEALSNAGAYGIHDLNIVRYTFSGRAAREVIASADPEDLLQIGESTLARYIPVSPVWRRQFSMKSFRQGLCAYTPHHARLIDRIHQESRRVRGLYLTGDYIQGASIEACFRSASACVTQLERNERYQEKENFNEQLLPWRKSEQLRSI